MQKLVSEISNIVGVSSDSAKEKRAEIVNKILGTNFGKNDSFTSIENAVKRYYQLTSLKRSLFKCTEVTYDLDSGRVNGMSFEVELDGGNIKQD